jgi:hypothetical protein
MKILTEKAVLECAHINGVVIGIPAGQDFVTVEGVKVLVEKDPEGRPIVGCPNAGPNIKPCTSTLVVKTGYSGLVRIGGSRVCLDPVSGLTDGTPPGTVEYRVRSPGQSLVDSGA